MGKLYHIINFSTVDEVSINNNSFYIEDEHIKYKINEEDNLTKIIDCENNLLIPGIIDISLNIDVLAKFIVSNSLNNKLSVEKINIELSKCCITNYVVCVTIESLKFEATQELLKTIVSKTNKNCLGIHVICLDISITIKNFDHYYNWFIEYIQSNANLVKILTIKPEIENVKMVEELCDKYNIKLAYGYTEISYDEIQKINITKLDLLYGVFTTTPEFHHRNTGVLGRFYLRNDEQLKPYVAVAGNNGKIHSAVFDALYKIVNDKLILASCTNYSTLQCDACNYSSIIYDKPNDKKCIDDYNNEIVENSLYNSIKCKHVTSDGVKSRLKNLLYSASYAPAKLLDLYPNIGSITDNSVANFAILNKHSLEVLLLVSNGTIVIDYLSNNKLKIIK